jgi:integrase
MNPGTLLQNSDLALEANPLTLGWSEDPKPVNHYSEGDECKRASILPATGAVQLAKKDTSQDALQIVTSGPDEYALMRRSAMTIADFVAAKFVPEHVAIKLSAGRLHYRSILKHVLTSEEVNRAFQVVSEKSKTRLKSRMGWPYLGHFSLGEVRAEHVQRLISAALKAGYSTQTAAHIRNVVSAIFSHARKEKFFMGDNPARMVALPEMMHKRAHALTPAQLKEVLLAMQFPEKEITLIAILTGMTVTEICGLRWKNVNLTDEERVTEGERIPPRMIAVRKQWSRGELGKVKQRRNRNLPIPLQLFPILRELSLRGAFTGPDDYVLTSRVGTPINQTNIVARRLKPIGQQLQMPWLSWRIFSYTRKALVSEFGTLFEQYAAVMVRFSHPKESDSPEKWHCRNQRHGSPARSVHGEKP